MGFELQISVVACNLLIMAIKVHFAKYKKSLTWVKRYSLQ